jgi:outer membrane scaffolding protein for murein synthesis (MipA/OmpV family)
LGVDIVVSNMTDNVRVKCCIWILLLFGGFTSTVQAQTPAPLQEWQYSGGVILARLFDPNLPTFRTVVGLAAETQPVYEGASAYKVRGGPVIDIHYKDIAYLTTGEGLGYNFLRGDHYQLGVGITYDQGRRERDDYNNLRGMGDISLAAVAKVYGTWVLSKSFPLILRASARQFAGGAQGAIADVSVYMPLPGSSKTFVMFAGPSISLATSHYLQNVFGVTPRQSLASGHPIYNFDRSGTDSIGLGFSATKFFTEHWMVNLDAAYSEIEGRAVHSPIVETRTQRELAVSVAYYW